MSRRKDSLERRRRRFLLPLFQFPLPALAFIIFIHYFEQTICNFMQSQAPNAACVIALPSVMSYMIWAAVFLGVAMSGWRFYRDHICGDIYDDLF